MSRRELPTLPMPTLHPLLSERDEETTERYIEAWKALAEPLEELFDAKLHSFDPHICLLYKGRVITFDTDVALTIGTALQARIKREIVAEPPYVPGSGTFRACTGGPYDEEWYDRTN